MHFLEEMIYRLTCFFSWLNSKVLIRHIFRIAKMALLSHSIKFQKFHDYTILLMFRWHLVNNLQKISKYILVTSLSNTDIRLAKNFFYARTFYFLHSSIHAEKTTLSSMIAFMFFFSTSFIFFPIFVIKSKWL